MNTVSPVHLIGAKLSPIWSGESLCEKYSSFSDCGRVGEVWLTSVTDDCPAYARHFGQLIPFAEYLRLCGLEAPPLVKLLDTSLPLSVQIHPDREAAARHGGIPKSELWYILSAAPDAHILYGTKEGLTEGDVRDAIFDGSIEEKLCRINVKVGEVYMLPSGMLHSLGAGITVLEVQNLAGSTYRVKDIAGTREVHTVEASDSLHIYTEADAAALALSDMSRLRKKRLVGTVLAATPDFAVTRYSAEHGRSTLTVSAGVCMFCERGGGSAEGTEFFAGDSLFFGYEGTLTLNAGSCVIFTA